MGYLCDVRDATPYPDPAIASAPSYPCPLQSSIDSPWLSISFKIAFDRCSPVRPVLQCINPTSHSFTRKFESKYLKTRDICSLLLTSEASSARILKNFDFFISPIISLLTLSAATFII